MGPPCCCGSAVPDSGSSTSKFSPVFGQHPPQQFAPAWSQYPAVAQPMTTVPPQQPFVPSQRSHGTPPQRSNGLATAGLVVGIVGAVFSVIPVIGTVAWGLAPIGLVLSIVGLIRSRTVRTGRGTSIAGIVLSVVALVMCVLWTTAFVAGASNVSQQAAAVHQVTYKVTTSKDSKIAATYSQSQGDQIASATVSDVTSPWSENASVSGLIGPTLTASISPDPAHVAKKDTISCTIIEDGVQVAQNSATGTDAMVTCTK